MYVNELKIYLAYPWMLMTIALIEYEICAIPTQKSGELCRRLADT